MGGLSCRLLLKLSYCLTLPHYYIIIFNTTTLNINKMIIYRVRHLTFFSTSAYFVNGNTFSSCLIWQIISFILGSNEYGCVHAWTKLGNFACDRLTEDADLGQKKIIFSDEAHFDLGVYVNKQNCRIWGTENPHAYIEKPTHPKRVTVWCGFWPRGIIGPFFFENKQGEAVTVNGDIYRAMLKEFFFTKIEEENIGNIWF